MIIITVISLFLSPGISSSAFCATGAGHFGAPRLFIGDYFGFPNYPPYWYYPYYYRYSYPYPCYPDAYASPPVNNELEQVPSIGSRGATTLLTNNTCMRRETSSPVPCARWRVGTNLHHRQGALPGYGLRSRVST
jgi:hypothetical protein